MNTWNQFRLNCLKSQIKFKSEFLEILPTIETVFIKEEIIDPSSPIIKIETDPVKNSKPEKYWEWSDDDFFTPENPEAPKSSVKLVKEDSEEEIFELITIVDDDNPIEIIEDIVNIKSKPIEMEEKPTEREEVKPIDKDKYSSTESEPDFFNFDDPKKIEVPAIKKRIYRKRISPNPNFELKRKQDKKTSNAALFKLVRKQKKKVETKEVCHICGKYLRKQSIEFHLNYHNGMFHHFLKIKI